MTFLFALLTLVVSLFAFPVHSEEEPDRSPNALAVSPDGTLLLTANPSSDSLSLIDLRTKRVIQELPCPGEPWDVCWIEDARFGVSLRRGDAIAIGTVHNGTIQIDRRIPIGNEPGDLTALTRGEESWLVIALTGENRVRILSAETGQELKSLPVGNRPRYLALTPDQSELVTCCELPGEILVHDTTSWELLSRQEVYRNSFNLGRPAMTAEGDLCLLPFSDNREFPITKGNIARGWAINNRVVKLRLPSGPALEQRQMALDLHGRAAADPNAVAISPQGNWLAITCGGTHELLLLPWKEVPWPPGDPEDFGPHRLSEVPGLYRRVPLGGRPLDLAFIDEKLIAVANSLSHSVQLINPQTAQVIAEILLGGPVEPSLARRGEKLFYDGTLSLHNWFSCHTCHPEGGTSGQSFDTLNDGSYDTFKLTPSLLGVVGTPPWMWHGWQYDLESSVIKSVRSTLASERPFTEQESAALMAYLSSLQPPERPAIPPEEQSAVARGRKLFQNKAGCTSCHAGDVLTTPTTYRIGLETGNMIYSRFNPPSLRGLHTRRRFLHDGRAKSLEEVLRYYHVPGELSGETLTPDETHDLLRYLKTL